MIVKTNLSTSTFNAIVNATTLLIIKPLAALLSISFSSTFFSRTLRKTGKATIVLPFLSGVLEGYFFHVGKKSSRWGLKFNSLIVQLIAVAIVLSLGTFSEVIFSLGQGVQSVDVLAEVSDAIKLVPSTKPVYGAENAQAATLLSRAVRFCTNIEDDNFLIRNIVDSTKDSFEDQGPAQVEKNIVAKCAPNSTMISVRVCASGLTLQGSNCTLEAPVLPFFGFLRVGDLTMDSRHSTFYQADSAKLVGETPLMLIELSGIKSRAASDRTSHLYTYDMLTDPEEFEELTPPKSGICGSGSFSNEGMSVLPGSRAVQVCAWDYDNGTLITGSDYMNNINYSCSGSSLSNGVPEQQMTLECIMVGVTSLGVNSVGRWVWFPNVHTRQLGDIFSVLSLLRVYLEASIDANLDERKDDLNQLLWQEGRDRILYSAVALTVGSGIEISSSPLSYVDMSKVVVTYDVVWALPLLFSLVLAITSSLFLFILNQRNWRVGLQPLDILARWSDSEKNGGDGKVPPQTRSMIIDHVNGVQHITVCQPKGEVLPFNKDLPLL